MKCNKCEHLKIVQMEDGCGADAKCFNTSKKGKSILWAMTALRTNNEDNTCFRISGKERVKEYLKVQKSAPSWCPLRKNEKGGN